MKALKTINPIAKALRDPRFKQRIVRARKGSGSYRRKDRA